MWRSLKWAVVLCAVVPTVAFAQRGGDSAGGRALSASDIGARLPGDLRFKPSLPPGVMVKPELAVGDWRRKHEEVIMPAGPKETSDTLLVLARQLATPCGGGNQAACRRAQGFTASAERLAAAYEASKPCEQAAREFRKAYSSGLPGREVANFFDIACLGSFTLRRDQAGASVVASRPPLLSDADQPGGLLTAVGLLQRGGAIFCAGLIRSDRSFITARHCVPDGRVQGLSVRNGRGDDQGAVLSIADAPSEGGGVAADWIVLQLPSGGGAPVARTNLVTLSSPAEVTLVAPYPYAEGMTYVQEEAFPRRALRFPREGMCQALVNYKGCLQLVCQTVRGFSGAPIFSSRRSDGSFDVVGFVSGSEGSDSFCTGTAQVPNSTYAVSASAFVK